MAITYYKRFRMEIELASVAPPGPLLDPYFWAAWTESLLEVHAEVKYQSFRDELDTRVFPCLGDRNGCTRLMREIRRKSGFLPEATWLIGGARGYVATIQGVIDNDGLGSIQNVGVVPAHRGLGLGEALVRKCLGGFRRVGLKRAYLEVTAENVPAVRLYRRLGFTRSKTLYKAVDWA